ncbi:MAG TPA: hypothetical protein VK498_10585 [Ferruginibacter sp.]|nr:hypothetical protein [Ferruginibacter sp.]
MLQDLTIVPSGDLVDMLLKDTQYYMDLKADGNYTQRAVVKKHIEQIIAEIKNREGFKEALQDEDTSAGTTE